MKVEFGSDDKSVQVTVSAGNAITRSSSTMNLLRESAPRKVAVSVLSTAESVSLSIKPSVIAQEERQARLSRSIKLGFAPVSKSTKG